MSMCVPRCFASAFAVEQRSERTKERVGINSITVDPLKPMFATGGTDPLGEITQCTMPLDFY